MKTVKTIKAIDITMIGIDVCEISTFPSKVNFEIPNELNRNLASSVTISKKSPQKLTIESMTITANK